MNRNKAIMMKTVFLLIPMLLFLGACAQNNSHKKSASIVSAHKAYGLIKSSDTAWTQRVIKTDAEWKKILSPDAYYILRESGTERSFTSNLLEIHDNGVFFCAACNNPLFSSASKFESGTGWPSFWMPISKNSVSKSTDSTFGMTRDEIRCKKCGGHLGHVFEDGPEPTGLRYCMNGDALKFVKGK